MINQQPCSVMTVRHKCATKYNVPKVCIQLCYFHSKSVFVLTAAWWTCWGLIREVEASVDDRVRSKSGISVDWAIEIKTTTTTTSPSQWDMKKAGKRTYGTIERLCLIAKVDQLQVSMHAAWSDKLAHTNGCYFPMTLSTLWTSVTN